jgi:probable HAF family extracellular repeat protein
LGVLAGDAVSYAFGINSRGQIVGQSCTPGCAGSRAFLYQNGTMYDLNALLDSASAGYDLIFANDINDAGQIAGLAVDPAGNIVAFRLTPDAGRVAQGVQAVTAVRSHPSISYHLHMGPMGRPILTR